MSKYEDMLNDLKKSKGSNYSKNELTALATAMFNDVNTEIPVYVKRGDTFEQTNKMPAKDLRDNLLAPIVKATFGVDKAELGRLDDAQTTRAGGEALANFSLLLVKEYIAKRGLGRKLTLPMTSPDETVQSICTTGADEETRETTMIVHEGDKYSTVPTGKTVTTKAHQKLKVANRVPGWLKTATETKKS